MLVKVNCAFFSVVASVVLACSQMKEVYLFPLTNYTDVSMNKRKFVFFYYLIFKLQDLILFTQYACPIIEESGMSTGTMLLIVFFFLTVFYFVFGAVLLHFIRGAQGIEMIPNLQFWKGLPYLVRVNLLCCCLSFYSINMFPVAGRSNIFVKWLQTYNDRTVRGVW